MRISDHIIPAALFTVGLGLVSAFGFEGSGGQNSNAAPTVGVDVMPRTSAVTAPALAPPNVAVPTLAVPNMPGNNSGTMRVPAPAPSRSIGPVPLPGPSHAMTAAEAFRTGMQLLQAGDAKGGVSALEYAAEHGHPIAQWKLGRMFADGDQVGRDEARAFRFFQELVENHSDDSLGTPQSRYVANAFVTLGGYYLAGIANSSIKANPQRARDLFAYAASYLGDAAAQYRLGQMLLEGHGGPKDPWQAARWLKLSADKGYYPAQALPQHLDGPVVLQVWVARDGTVRDVKLIRGYFALGRAAFDAVRQWRFKPYGPNGRPIDFQTVVTVNFKYPG